MKERKAKENSPAGEKLPKILSHGSKISTPRSAEELPNSSDRKFLLLPLFRIFNSNFSQAGLILGSVCFNPFLERFQLNFRF
ncbi:MAG: hypothetical protein IPL53_21285 [Ignavibacteria bacterium]|nr:hypothetical protein [Ignavibacteria bacterium]